MRRPSTACSKSTRSTGPRRTARAAIGLRKEDLSAGAARKDSIVDLRPSDLAEIVSGLLSQLALGNRKSCNLEVLELDQSSGRLEAEFTLRHQHVWPTLREAQAPAPGEARGRAEPT